MTDFDVVTRDHVLSAIAEHDERGADAFLTAYGFGKTSEFLLHHEGTTYDATAILGVAYKHATGTAASRRRLGNGKHQVAEILQALEFETTYVDTTALAADPATGEWRDVADVGAEEARDVWAEAARGVLIDVAGRYHALITHKELATQVQNLTGIRTKQMPHYWIGDVLTRVAAECDKRDEPLLAAFCITADGSVSSAYGPAVLAATGSAPADADDHAAKERLKAHRHFDADDLPEGGGVPALSDKLAATRGRERKIRHQEREIAKCPQCYLQLPATGVCDNCA